MEVLGCFRIGIRQRRDSARLWDDGKEPRAQSVDGRCLVFGRETENQEESRQVGGKWFEKLGSDLGVP